MTLRDSNLKLAIKNCFKPTDHSIAVLEPHLGLGDNLICLGLVRELSKREPNTHFYYACLHRCYHSLAWMFQDLDNVFLFAVKGGRQARQLAGFLNARYVPIGLISGDLTLFSMSSIRLPLISAGAMRAFLPDRNQKSYLKCLIQKMNPIYWSVIVSRALVNIS